MIVIEGQLNIKSADSTIALKNEGAQLVCDVRGWPKDLSLSTIRKLTKISKSYALQPVIVYYNGEKMGEYHEGKIRKRNYLTFLKVFASYLKSKF